MRRSAAVALVALLSPLTLAVAPAAAVLTGPCSDVSETLCGDGGPATAGRLLRPAGVAADVRGGFLIADTSNDAVRRVLPDGTITTLAGLGVAGYAGDGQASLFAQLNAPTDVASAEGGTVLIADAGNHAIRAIAPDGVIRTVAGSGGATPSATPVPAKGVRLIDPQGVAAVPGGGLLIADAGANEVLRVAPDGKLSVAAGVGGPGGFTGDGGPATGAALSGPTRVVAEPDGGFDVLDLGNQVIRRVAADGTITTVPNVVASVAVGVSGSVVNPGGLTRDAAGDLLYTADRRVVRLTPEGTTTVVAGANTCGSTGDGGPPLDAELVAPGGLAVTAEGAVLIADLDSSSGDGNVRELSPAADAITTVAGPANTGADGCIGAGGAPSGAIWGQFYITAPRSAHARRTITITFVTSLRVKVRTALLHSGKSVRTSSVSARVGRNVVSLAGVGKGSYTMRITAHATVPNNNADAGGTLDRTKTYSAPLKVTR